MLVAVVGQLRIGAIVACCAVDVEGAKLHLELREDAGIQHEVLRVITTAGVLASRHEGKVNDAATCLLLSFLLGIAGVC